MYYKRFQAVAQVVGYITIGLLAVYGLLALLGGSPALASALNLSPDAPDGDIPATFNYQGLLRDPDGGLTNGAYTLTTRIYTLTASGADIYHETFYNVNVRDGLFNIVLGDDPQGQDVEAAFAGAPRYLGVTLEGQGGELIPRQRLHSAPWALYATHAMTATTWWTMPASTG